jgi:serine/threonine protein kinase
VHKLLVAAEVLAGRYRLVERLGAGGMSEVWAADDTELDRRVALKLLAPQADTERFRREARAVAAVSHPNVNQLYDYGEAEGRPYMVLECLTGGSLQDRLAPGSALPDAETRAIAADIAAGLAHAHARGLVHRDLKPANVLFDSEGRAKIADFGIARLNETGTLTEAGTVIGTATTISPEQAGGEPATPASDVYSFGVLLFWMLTGRPPFVSDSPMELLHLHRHAVPPAVSSLRADAPPDLAALACEALEKDPAARPGDGAALLRALGTGSATATMPLEPVPTSQGRRRPQTAALAVLALAGLAAAGTAVAFGVGHDSGASQPASTTIPSLKLPKVSTQAPTPVAAATGPATTHATTSTTMPTTTARPAPTTHAAVTITPPITLTTEPATTDNPTTTAPPAASPPLQGTTTVGSGP